MRKRPGRTPRAFEGGRITDSRSRQASRDTVASWVVPERATRVPTACARVAAPAARGRPRHHRAGERRVRRAPPSRRPSAPFDSRHRKDVADRLILLRR